MSGSRMVHPFNGILRRMAGKMITERPAKKVPRRSTARLTDDQVRYLRSDAVKGRLRQVAEELGITFQYAEQIRLGYCRGNVI